MHAYVGDGSRYCLTLRTIGSLKVAATALIKLLADRKFSVCRNDLFTSWLTPGDVN